MLENLHLTEDPFPIVPDGPVHNWAGRVDLRDDVVDLVKGVRGRDIGVSEFVVLHGELGAGKSHALRFLKTLIDDESAKADGHFRSLALYIERPRVATKLNFLELYKYIIRLIGRERIHSYCVEVQKTIEELARELAVVAGMGQARELSSFRQAAIEKTRSNDRQMISLLLKGAEDESYIYNFLSGNTVCTQEGYEGKIDSDFMAAKVLSDLFRVLTYDFKPKMAILESVYLFIDEGEMLVDAKATESELVFTGLRELINGLPYRFGLIISFSAATALIEAIMPNHLLKRMTRPYIEIPMLSDEEAVGFLKSQINFYRPNGSKYIGTFYPFTEDAIRYIVENINNSTPRNLFIDCKRVYERAIRRHNLQADEWISRDLAQTILGGSR